MPGIALRAEVVGNWKMNGSSAALNEVRLLAGMLKDVHLRCGVTVCPPATLAHRAAELVQGTGIAVGGQDCHWEPRGAHTGDVSAEMLKDAGCAAVILGHSERRTDHGETDAVVLRKAAAAYRAGLAAIICIGETLAERQTGRTLEIVSRQLEGSLPPDMTPMNTIVAYEPVWAIGSGLTPTGEQVAEVHTAIRAALISRLKGEAGNNVRILYGGSVKPANAQSLMAVTNVNGALVGGGSLKAADFIGIIKAYA